MDRLETDKQGFNSIYMMLDSGASGSKEQIKSVRWYERSDGKTAKVW